MDLRRQKVEQFLEILIRVPPIFLMDIISNRKNSMTIDGWAILTSFHTTISHLTLNKRFYESSFVNFEKVFHLILQILGYMFALFLFVQNNETLFTFYFTISAAGVILWSFILNKEFVKYCSELLNDHSSMQNEFFFLNKEAVQVFFFHYVSQTFFAIVFCFYTVNLLNYPCNKLLIGLLFLFPIAINVILPSSVLSDTPILVAGILCVVLMTYVMKKLITFVPMKLSHLYNMLLNFKLDLVSIFYNIILMWRKHNVTDILKLFIVIRIIKNLFFLVYDHFYVEYFKIGDINFNQLVHVFKEVSISNFENIVSICGTAVILSALIDKFVYKPLQSFLMLSETQRHNDSHMFAQLLVLLCLKLGVTTMEPVERLNVVKYIGQIVCISVINSFNQEFCKELVSLCAIGYPSFKKHTRVLITAFAIFTICTLWLTSIFQTHMADNWLVPLVGFNIETLVTLIISSFIYLLQFILLHSSTIWFELYDYVYYLESTKHVITFFLSIVIFVKGVYKFPECASLIRLIFLGIHFYHNIFNRLINGLKQWNMRRLVIKCVKSLPVATLEEVRELDDVCAICLNEMTKHVVSITRCHHFFSFFLFEEMALGAKNMPLMPPTCFIG